MGRNTSLNELVIIAFASSDGRGHPQPLGTMDLAAKAAADGAGLAYIEQREAQPFLASGTLVQVLADWTPPFEGEALYYPRQRLPSAAFRAFVDYVKRWKAVDGAAKE